jgi:hypothetical protein
MSATLEAKARVRQDQQDCQEFCISKPKIKNRVDPVNPVGNALFRVFQFSCFRGGFGFCGFEEFPFQNTLSVHLFAAGLLYFDTERLGKISGQRRKDGFSRDPLRLLGQALLSEGFSGQETDRGHRNQEHAGKGPCIFGKYEIGKNTKDSMKPVNSQ